MGVKLILQVCRYKIPARIDRGIPCGQTHGNFIKIIKSIPITVCQYWTGSQRHALIVITQSIPIRIGKVWIRVSGKLFDFIQPIPVAVAGGISNQRIKSMNGLPDIR